MVWGLGIDMVHLPEFGRLLRDGDESGPALVDTVFARHTFTADERAYAAAKADPAESLAGMFAVKEAVVKAVSPYVGGAVEPFDLRRIEVAHRADGSPYVACKPPVSTFLEQAGAGSILVSITNEADYAAAVAVLQGEAAPPAAAGA